MDDKTRRVGGQREQMTGRGDDTTRNLDATVEDTTAARPAGAARASNTSRRGTSGSTRSKASAAEAEGLDRETDARTRELQAEIADTREELSETIEAIQERLRPGSIVSNATDTVKEKARQRVQSLTDNAGERASGMMRQSRRTANDVVENVKHNPVPALMIGAGVAWLLMDRSRHEDGRRWETRQRGWSTGRRSYGEYGTGYETNYVEAGTGLDLDTDIDESDADYSDIDYRRGYASRQRGLASNVSERASSMMHDAGDRLQRTTRSTTNGLQRLMRENPLLVGAAAVLVGAAVGAALPETERENQLMGETRDTVVNQAQEMAQNAASTVKEVASNIPTQVTEAVTSKVLEGSDASESKGRRTNQPVGTTGTTGSDTWRRE
jgi:ElaB/YqjD/DUF883 family membrane-anchored ribosome-binding protein